MATVQSWIKKILFVAVIASLTTMISEARASTYVQEHYRNRTGRTVNDLTKILLGCYTVEWAIGVNQSETEGFLSSRSETRTWLFELDI